jgi:starvation-inducible DNA-binding protein
MGRSAAQIEKFPTPSLLDTRNVRAYTKRDSAHGHIRSRRHRVTTKKRENGTNYNQMEAGTQRAKPILHQHAKEIQPYGKIAKLSIALDETACESSINNLNQLLADTMTLRDMYKKHHWQVAGATFYQLHLLFDKHHGEQDELVDTIAERIQLLGGVSIAMAADVAETTIIPLAAGKKLPCKFRVSSKRTNLF